LQAAGRWAEAYRMAVDLAAGIPKTEEFKSRRVFLESIASAAGVESAVASGSRDLQAISPSLDDECREDSLLVSHALARSKARRQLVATPIPDPAAAAVEIDAAILTMQQTSGGDYRVELFIGVLRIVASLLRHDEIVRRGQEDAPQNNISAARRNAKFFASSSRGKIADDDPMARFFQRATSAADDDLDDLIAMAGVMPIALPLCDSAFRRPRRHQTAEAEGVQPTQPMFDPVVSALHIDGNLVLGVQVLKSEYIHDLRVDLRMREWPAWADGCRVEFLSSVTDDAVVMPTYEFRRDDVTTDSRGVHMAGTGHLTVRSGRVAGAPPLEFAVHAYFHGSGREEVVDVVGYERLLLRPYDPSRDALTPHKQINERLLEMYAELHEDPTLSQDDIAAFSRFYSACVRAAQNIIFDAKYLSGRGNLTEREFHDDLERALAKDPELSGRLNRGEPLAGGFHDLIHDDIVAELKVEKKTARTLENCKRYLGQPTQYGVGRGSRISILVVFDHSKKNLPPAVLENHIGWLFPKQPGIDDTKYPSRVALLIVNTNWSVPSAWSRRRIETRDAP